AGRLVVPDLNELLERLGRSRSSLQHSVRRSLERERQRLVHARTRLDRPPALTLERQRASLEHAHRRLRAWSPRATLARGYAIVRVGDGVVVSPPPSGTHVDVELAEGGFGATVD